MVNAVLFTFILIADKPFLRFDVMPEDDCEEIAEEMTKEAKEAKINYRYMCIPGEHTVEAPDDDWILATLENLQNGFIPTMVVGMTEWGKDIKTDYFYNLASCKEKHALCAYTTQKIMWKQWI